MVLASIGMAWFAVRWRHAQQQRRAVAAMAKMGGRAIYDSPIQRRIHNKPVGMAAPDWLRNLLGEDFFDEVIELDFNYGHVNDEGLAHVKEFRRLRWISLFNSHVTRP
jgi:hypothetical protein